MMRFSLVSAPISSKPVSGRRAVKLDMARGTTCYRSGVAQLWVYTSCVSLAEG